MPKHLENEYEVLNLAEFLAYIDEYKLGKK
jgi:hypothetical protein